MQNYHVRMSPPELLIRGRTRRTDPHFLIKMYKSPPSIVFFFRVFYSFLAASTAHKFAHKQKAHVLLCKVGQKLLCALQCH